MLPSKTKPILHIIRSAWSWKCCGLLASAGPGFPTVDPALHSQDAPNTSGVLSHQGRQRRGRENPFTPGGASTHTFFPSNTLPLPISTLSPLYTLFCLRSQKEVEFSAPLLSLTVARIRALKQQHNKTPKIQRIKVESQRPLWCQRLVILRPAPSS